MTHFPRFPGGFTPPLQLVLRWAHFAAGITWVGQIYFFVLVNGPSLRETDGDRLCSQATVMAVTATHCP